MAECVCKEKMTQALILLNTGLSSSWRIELDLITCQVLENQCHRFKPKYRLLLADVLTTIAQRVD